MCPELVVYKEQRWKKDTHTHTSGKQKRLVKNEFYNPYRNPNFVSHPNLLLLVLLLLQRLFLFHSHCFRYVHMHVYIDTYYIFSIIRCDLFGVMALLLFIQIFQLFHLFWIILPLVLLLLIILTHSLSFSSHVCMLVHASKPHKYN